jgi:hypothetical protein
MPSCHGVSHSRSFAFTRALLPILFRCKCDGHGRSLLLKKGRQWNTGSHIHACMRVCAGHVRMRVCTYDIYCVDIQFMRIYVSCLFILCGACMCVHTCVRVCGAVREPMWQAHQRCTPHGEINQGGQRSAHLTLPPLLALSVSLALTRPAGAGVAMRNDHTSAETVRTRKGVSPC